MRIWILDCDVDKYENLMWGKEITINDIQSFDGREKLENWNSMQVKRMYDREFSNSPGFSPHIPVFDRKAIESLGNFFIGNAEILPLKCIDKDFFAINVTKVIDCINYEKSKYKTFRDGKRIMRFTKYVFEEEKIKGVDLFKIKDEPLKRPFVSDAFRKKVIDSNLTGFKFELAWECENI